MSERVLAALAALALIAPGAAGQTPTVAEFAARARRLDTLAARADAFARRADSLRRAGITLDSARDGALLVLAGPHEVGLARDGVRLAWTGLDRTFGARAQLLAGNQFLLYQLGQQDPVPDSGGWYSGPSHVRYAIVSVAGWANAQDVSRTLLPNAANVIAQHEDSTFRLWLQAVITPGGVTQDLFRSVYNELVTAPWRASRGCFLGDLGACRRALALSGGGDPWVDWYASGDYRALVRDLTLARGDPALVNACLRTDDEAACLSVLRGNWYAPWYAQHGHRVPAPVS